jgi:selenide,water dikinase
MGGKPLFALALVGMPLGKLPEDVIRRILAGGESVCRAAGIPIAGGHSIDVLEPIYGLVGLGVVHPKKVKRNSGAQAGDVLILSKPLGIGMLSAALKKGKLSEAGYREMVKWTTKLNTPGIGLAEMEGVHAVTDVTGFGLAGHLLEICRGSKLDGHVRFSQLPLIEEACQHASTGIATGASNRNWSAYGHEVRLADELAEWQRNLVTDPQTSGGLLVSCAPGEAEAVLALMRKEGFDQAAVIGELGATNGAVPILEIKA